MINKEEAKELRKQSYENAQEKIKQKKITEMNEKIVKFTKKHQLESLTKKQKIKLIKEYEMEKDE